MSWVCTRVYACVSSSTHMYGGQKSVMNALNHLPHYFFFLHQGSFVGPGDGQFGYCGWLTNCKDTAVLRLQMHQFSHGYWGPNSGPFADTCRATPPPNFTPFVFQCNREVIEELVCAVWDLGLGPKLPLSLDSRCCCCGPMDHFMRS